MSEQLNINGNATAPQTAASRPVAPSEPPPRLFTHQPQLRGQTAFLDQRSLVLASLKSGHGKDAAGRKHGLGL